MKINLGTLANLDPAVVRTAASADDPQLAGILASDRSTPVTGLPPHRRRTTGWVVAGAATVVVAMAIFGFSQVGAVAPRAFADWTPQPGEVTAQQKQQLYDDCASLIQDRVVVNSLGQSISSRGATSVIVDQRGSYHAMLVGSSTMWGLCSNLTGTGELYGEITTNYTDPDWVVPPDDITFIAGRSGSVFGPDGPNVPMPSTDGDDAPFFELGAGRAGDNVVAIQAVTNMGQIIDASLVDGFWLVYGPIDWDKVAADPGSGGLVEYIVTLRDGRVQHVSNDDIGRQCFGPTPHAPAGYACLPENIYVQTAAPVGFEGQTPQDPITAPPSAMYAPPSAASTDEVKFVVLSTDGTILSGDGTEQVFTIPGSTDGGVVVRYSSDGATPIYPPNPSASTGS